MAKFFINEISLIKIADAIRNKKNIKTKIKVKDMPKLINEIQASKNYQEENILHIFEL